MKKYFESITLTKMLAILLPAALGWALTLFSIYVLGVYGALSFLIAPFFMGYYPPRILGQRIQLTKAQCFTLAATCLGVYTIGVLLFAIEGLICLAMSAPIGIGMAAVGVIAENKMRNRAGKIYTAIPLFIVPVVVYPDVKSMDNPAFFNVRSQVEISAPPSKVWASVIEFPPIKESPSFLFQMGVAYPTHAEILGNGVGAIRRCHFSTGAFIEPITEWKVNQTLAFDVIDQPIPMKELSPWPIDPPHLHGYFKSVKGRFDLIENSNGSTLLIGTTWCESHLVPNWYWRLWIKGVVHSIHNRVLSHIKENAETKT